MSPRHVSRPLLSVSLFSLPDLLLLDVFSHKVIIVYVVVKAQWTHCNMSINNPLFFQYFISIMRLGCEIIVIDHCTMCRNRYLIIYKKRILHVNSLMFLVETLAMYPLIIIIVYCKSVALIPVLNDSWIVLPCSPVCNL